MIIGIDANEANQEERVGSNVFAFEVLWQFHTKDKKNRFIVYLKKPPLKDLPRQRKNWQYRILKPGFCWTQWRLPLSLFFQKPCPQVFLTLGHYAPRLSPVPRLICIMDLAFLHFPQTFLKKDLKKLKNWTKYSVKKALHIFTISQFSKKEIMNHYQIPAEKITVAYPGVKIRENTPLSNYSNYLLYLGTLQPRKNIKNLVKAFAALPPEHSQFKLIIAGKKGWMHQSLFDLVKKLKLTQKVIFTGYIKKSQVQSLIKDARCLILPSYYEGFGIPVVQAMKLKTPVLVSQNSSLTEIVSQSGYFIKPPFSAEEIKKGIIKLLNSQDQKTKVNQAYLKSKQFTWQSTYQQIKKAIYELNF